MFTDQAWGIPAGKCLLFSVPPSVCSHMEVNVSNAEQKNVSCPTTATFGNWTHLLQSTVSTVY